MSDDIDNGGKGGFMCCDMMWVMVVSGMMVVGGGGLLMSVQLVFVVFVLKCGGKIWVVNEFSLIVDMFDLVKGLMGVDYICFFMFYSGFMQFDGSFMLQMNFVELLYMIDVKIWIIKLCKGVMFYDGKFVGLVDVVFLLMCYKNVVIVLKVKLFVDQFVDVKVSGLDEVMFMFVSVNVDLLVIFVML